jgi:hypothetical protein
MVVVKSLIANVSNYYHVYNTLFKTFKGEVMG